MVQALWKVPKERKKERTRVKRLIYLATAALVAMLILVPAAMAQEQTVMMEETMMMERSSPERWCAGRCDTLAALPCSSAEALRAMRSAAQVASVE